MKTLDEVLVVLGPGFERPTVERYIAETWVRPVHHDEEYYFEEIDIARLRLVQELRYDLAVGDESLGVVLSLLDQLYGLRHRMQRLGQAIARQSPEARAAIARHLESED